MVSAEKIKQKNVKISYFVNREMMMNTHTKTTRNSAEEWMMRE